MSANLQDSAHLVPESFRLERLTLRRPSLSDAEAIFAFGSDPEVARYADWSVRTSLGPLVESLAQRKKLWESGAEFYWVMTLHGDDRAIGAISCRLEGHAAEYGFLLNRDNWGVGYSTEASRAIVEWLLSLPGVWRVWATCDAENLASVRVLEKSGLLREGLLRRAIVRPNLAREPRDAFLYARVRDV